MTLRDESKAQRQSPLQDPAAVLGVPEGASVHTIRHAYRKRALKAHPDRGGDAEAFVSLQARFSKVCSMVPSYRKCTGALTFENVCLQRAYRALLAASGEDPERSPSEHANLAITHQEKPADAIDLQLREHRQLVESWFQRDGVDLSARAQALQARFSKVCSMVPLLKEKKEKKRKKTKK